MALTAQRDQEQRLRCERQTAKEVWADLTAFCKRVRSRLDEATFDRVLRNSAKAQRGVTLVKGHVDELLSERGHATGVKVHGRILAAGLVIDASGRARRFTSAVRAPAEGGDCGATYVTRQYQLHEAETAPPVDSPIGLGLSLPG